MKNLIFVIGYSSDLLADAEEMKQKVAFDFEVYPALASNLECHLDMVVIGTDAPLSQVQKLAKELRESCAVRPVDIFSKPTGAPLADYPIRVAVLEMPITEDKKDGLHSVYNQINVYRNDGELVVFAKGDKAVVLLTDVRQSNGDIFQQRLSKVLKRASLKGLFKDTWLLTV